MAQLLTSVNGGVVDVQTTTRRQGAQQLSRQYVEAKSLQSRPTEWVEEGRPIYRRLPSVSETYQIDFDADGEIGYCYIPWGEGIFGPVSTQVVATDTRKGIFVKGGVVVWKYGRNVVIPTLVDFTVLDVPPGRYLVGYDLEYDDEPFEAIYSVEDFALTGETLNLTSSTDNIVGWRYPVSSAFTNNSRQTWKNKDTLLPPYAQPAVAYVQWETELASAYSSITLRCPDNSSFTGTASLSYLVNGEKTPVDTVAVQSDEQGQYFTIPVNFPSFQTGWRVDFSDTSVSIQSVSVTGQITQVRRPSGPVPKASLSLYGNLFAPKDRVFCALAYVDVGDSYLVEEVIDIRNITHRNLEPVANWLTTFWDENLINLQQTIKHFAPEWMAPPSALKVEYENLTKEGVVLSDSVTLGQ